MYPRVTHPFATEPMMYCYLTDPVRLACLIHAASVRSEPESNSPKNIGAGILLPAKCIHSQFPESAAHLHAQRTI